MNTNLFVLQQQAQWALYYHLKEKAPETHRCFFKNVKKLRELYKNFVREVNANCNSLSKYQKQGYLNSVKTEFEVLKFSYNAPYLDRVFKSHGEDFQSFPEVASEELHHLLAVNCRKMYKKDTPPERIKEILQIRELQKEFVVFAYHLKVQKVLSFLLQSDRKKKESLANPEAGNLKEALLLNRQAEILFFRFLDQELNYLGSGASGLKEPSPLQEDKESLLIEMATARQELSLEIDNNLLLLPLENSRAYLKRIRKELEKKIPEFEQYDFDLMNRTKKLTVEPLLKLQLKNRKDIAEALREFNACRLEAANFILGRIRERLEDYSLFSAGDKQKAREIPTHKEFVAVLNRIKFFKLPVLMGQTDSDIAEFLAWATGRSVQNLRTALGTRLLAEDLTPFASGKIKEFFGEDLPPEP